MKDERIQDLVKLIREQQKQINKISKDKKNNEDILNLLDMLFSELYGRSQLRATIQSIVEEIGEMKRTEKKYYICPLCDGSAKLREVMSDCEIATFECHACRGKGTICK